MSLMKMGLLFRHHSKPSSMEGKTFEGKALQEGKMDTSSENVLMQKMLECVEAQAVVLKKITSHLFKIAKEEAKKDKANYGQSELTQEDIDCMMAKGKVHLLLPNFMP